MAKPSVLVGAGVFEPEVGHVAAFLDGFGSVLDFAVEEEYEEDEQ